MTVHELIQQAEQLSTDDKWYLVKQVLTSLEQKPETKNLPWSEFLKQTYGSLRDTPIERADQGNYEDREPLA
ncbi:MAG: hypothetical protein ACPG7F_21085 [Aggregatilineales bacterium]